MWPRKNIPITTRIAGMNKLTQGPDCRGPEILLVFFVGGFAAPSPSPISLPIPARTGRVVPRPPFPGLDCYKTRPSALPSPVKHRPIQFHFADSVPCVKFCGALPTRPRYALSNTSSSHQRRRSASWYEIVSVPVMRICPVSGLRHPDPQRS